ncbi:unnamed protein product [Arabidopsis thaliana]|uniref:Uncharacterized protein n=1 Tax=Arabidopsis thaliana TaxID=3702 RepID=A0A178V4F2_ARATH|nr:hypothetical protein AXX17_AT4G33540 [Arabidopsis thaliana]CAA0396885.1 unnamed protein product [Arabidopsis thaliana]
MICVPGPIIEALSSTTLSGAGEASVHRRRDPNFSSFRYHRRSSTQIKEGRLKQHALSFSHSSAAALWTDSCSELSHVEKDATPWIFATYLSHGHSLLPTIFYSSEMTPALQIISPFLDSRRSTSAFWHLDMKLGPINLFVSISSYQWPWTPFDRDITMENHSPSNPCYPFSVGIAASPGEIYSFDVFVNVTTSLDHDQPVVLRLSRG